MEEFAVDFKQAIFDHSDWKRKFRAALADGKDLDAESIARDDCCDVGKWLRASSNEPLRTVPSYGACVLAHAEFHREAGKIASAIRGGRPNEAETMLQPGMPYSAAAIKVVLALAKLEEEATSL
jgi:hypothetical protein